MTKTIYFNGQTPAQALTKKYPKTFMACKKFLQGEWRKSWNLVRAEMAFRSGAETVGHRPYFVIVEPANTCQLACPFCSTGSNHKTHKDAVLDIETYKSFMREMGPYLLYAEFMRNGEPLLNPNLYQMIDIARSYGIKTRFSTNLVSLPDNDEEEFIRHAPDVLVVSLDGASQETYGKYRVGGEFKEVISNLDAISDARDRLKSRRPEIIWQFIVFKHNEHEMAEAELMARELGLDRIQFITPFIPEESRAEWESPKFGSCRPCAQDGNGGRCNWLWGGMVLNSDASYSFCCAADPRVSDFASYEKEKPGEVWNGEFYRTARRHVVSGNAPDPSSSHPCVRCRNAGNANFRI